VRRRFLLPLVGQVELDLEPMPSTKRNSQALALIEGLDREWIVWTPQGYYDTSIEGDSRFLGWHTNPPFNQARPTDYVPIGTYAEKMRRPAVLDQLWRTADIGLALAAAPAGEPSPAAVAAAEQPPAIEIAPVGNAPRVPVLRGLWVVNQAQPRLRLGISALGTSKIRDRQVFFDERLLPRPPLAAPAAAVQEDLDLTLPPNRLVRLAVKSENVAGSARTEFVDLLYNKAEPPPPAPAAKPRLVIASMGVERFQNASLPALRYAENDAKDLAAFLTRHLVPVRANQAFEDRSEDRVVLTGKSASSQSFLGLMDRLRDEVKREELKQGDVVAVVIASHVLTFDGTNLIGTGDTAEGDVPRPSLEAQAISERLEELTTYGCRTVVFVDGVHELPEGRFKSNIREWVRDLQRKRGVITFIAAKEGPSGLDVRSNHGIFAAGLLNAFEAAGAVGARQDRTAALSLAQFKAAVEEQVLYLSDRQQVVGCYLPRTVSPRTTFVKP